MLVLPPQASRDLWSYSKIILYKEPLKFPLGFTYNLNVVQEIIAKESILTLDKSVRRCQEKPQDDCINKMFTDTLREKCQCLPFQSRFLLDEVCF